MSSVVFLVDMNAFFISCEMTRAPALREIPAAVAGDPERRTGIILAASYEARAKGVRTAMTVNEALRICPGLRMVPPDHAFYEKKSDEVMELLSGFSSVVEPNSIDEAWLDMTGSARLFGPPIDAARQIMQEINEKLGLWCSIGIAENKFLAKMASEMKKPHGITTLWPHELKEKMWPLPVNDLYGVGRKTAEKLAGYGFRTIGDLAGVEERILSQLLGKTGQAISRHARGIDPEPVIPHCGDSAKSIGRSVTLPQDIQRFSQAEPVLLSLADAVGREARQHGYSGRTVHITVKFADFSVMTRQMTIPRSSQTQDIYRAGCRLLEKDWQAERPIRLLGITLSGFDDASDDRQLTLYDTAGGPTCSNRQIAVDQAMDRIRDRFGENSVTRARQIQPGGDIDQD